MGFVTMYEGKLHLTPQTERGDNGRVTYSLMTHGDPVQFPGRRKLKRLARKFLIGELIEDRKFPRGPRGMFFSIPIGTSAENRAAFLGAVSHYTKTV